MNCDFISVKELIEFLKDYDENEMICLNATEEAELIVGNEVILSV